MQTYAAPAGRNAAMSSPAPSQEPRPALLKAPALAVVSAPGTAPQCAPGEYLKPVQGFTNSGVMPGKV